VGDQAWGDSELLIRRDPRASAYRDVFTQATIETVMKNGKRALPLGKVFATMPLALLEGIA